MRATRCNAPSTVKIAKTVQCRNVAGVGFRVRGSGRKMVQFSGSPFSQKELRVRLRRTFRFRAYGFGEKRCATSFYLNAELRSAKPFSLNPEPRTLNSFSA
jgi:hypothetical protein